MSKNIIVLGGSYLQVNFIESAKKLGYKPYVLDGNPFCYCARKGIGSFHTLDFSNKSLLRSFYKKIAAVGIFSPVNEFGNSIAAELAQDLNFYYNSVEVVNVSSDKKLFWKELQVLDLPKAKSFQERELAQEVLPVIVKPTVSTSSKGVSLVTEFVQIKEAISYAKRSGRSDDIRIEEYIEGSQYSLETLTVNGEHYLIGIVEEHMSDPPYFFERSDILDHTDQATKKEFFNGYVCKILNALGVEVGPCHIEVKVRNGQIHLIDFATRSGGWRDIMLSLSGIDYNAMIINAYLNGSSNSFKVSQAERSIGAAIMTYYDDFLSLKKAQEFGIIAQLHLNSQVPKLRPRGLADAYGYYFLSTSSKNEMIGFLPTF